MVYSKTGQGGVMLISCFQKQIKLQMLIFRNNFINYLYSNVYMYSALLNVTYLNVHVGAVCKFVLDHA